MDYSRKNFFIAILIVVTGSAFFLPFLGAVHLFDWDEINFAESAREMIATGNYSRVQIDYQPFWEKPPLFFWLQAASMQLFGITEFAARLPDAVAGIVTLLTFYLVGKKLYDARFGILWALCMMGSFLPFLYFKSGIIDPVFNYFIFLSITFFVFLVRNKKDIPASRYALLSGICIGIAALTKGPVAILILVLVVGIYWVSVRCRNIISLKGFLILIFSATLTSGIWFLIDVQQNGWAFLASFFMYQADLFLHPVAGHGGPLYYHFVVVFLGCFPMSVIALPALIKNYREASPYDYKKWMLILFWVVLILFTIVKTKIVHYSSLTYFPLAFIAAHVIYQGLQKGRLPSWVVILLIPLGAVFSTVLFAVPWLAQHTRFVIPYLNDPFAEACLRTSVLWSGWEQYIGAVYFLLLVSAVILVFRKKIFQGMVLMFIAGACSLLIYLKMVVPKIESYSQGPAIKFYESLQGKHAYVNCIGFKSYAQYFYFEKPPGDDSLSRSQEWLLKGNIDRTAYFVVKSTSMKMMQEFPEVQLLSEKGGFAFYIRKPHDTQ